MQKSRIFLTLIIIASIVQEQHAMNSTGLHDPFGWAMPTHSPFFAPFFYAAPSFSWATFQRFPMPSASGISQTFNKVFNNSTFGWFAFTGVTVGLFGSLWYNKKMQQTNSKLEEVAKTLKTELDKAKEASQALSAQSKAKEHPCEKHNNQLTSQQEKYSKQIIGLEKQLKTVLENRTILCNGLANIKTKSTTTKEEHTRLKKVFDEQRKKYINYFQADKALLLQKISSANKELQSFSNGNLGHPQEEENDTALEDSSLKDIILYGNNTAELIQLVKKERYRATALENMYKRLRYKHQQLGDHALENQDCVNDTAEKLKETFAEEYTKEREHFAKARTKAGEQWNSERTVLLEEITMLKQKIESLTTLQNNKTHDTGSKDNEFMALIKQTKLSKKAK